MTIKKTDATEKTEKPLGDPRGASAKVTAAFRERSNKLAKDKNWWFWISLFLVIVMLVIAVNGCRMAVYLLIDPNSRGEPFISQQWMFRISLELPVVFLFWFSVSRYRAERILEEDYSFKQIVAEVLPDYLEAVSNTHREDIIVTATNVLFRMPSAERADAKFKEALTGLKEVSEVMSNVKRTH